MNQQTDYSSQEVEDIVLKLKKEGKTQSEIGVSLRDSYGIGDVSDITGKSVGQILEEAGDKEGLPEDMEQLIKKAENLEEHLEEVSSKDLQSKRSLEQTKAKIRKLARYYKNQGAIDQDWKYESRQ